MLPDITNLSRIVCAQPFQNAPPPSRPPLPSPFAHFHPPFSTLPPSPTLSRLSPLPHTPTHPGTPHTYQEMVYILVAAPVGIAVSNFLFAMLMGLRVALHRVYASSDDLRSKLVVETANRAMCQDSGAAEPLRGADPGAWLFGCTAFRAGGVLTEHRDLPRNTRVAKDRSLWKRLVRKFVSGGGTPHIGAVSSLPGSDSGEMDPRGRF